MGISPSLMGYTAEQLSENAKAKDRARSLLDSIATKNDPKDTFYTVKSRLWPDVAYRVYDDSSTWIDVYRQDDFAGGLCLVVMAPYQPVSLTPVADIPLHGAGHDVAYEDQLIQKLLLLRYDETSAWNTANYGVWSRSVEARPVWVARYSKANKTLTFSKATHQDTRGGAPRNYNVYPDLDEEERRSRRRPEKKRSYFIESVLDEDTSKDEYYL